MEILNKRKQDNFKDLYKEAMLGTIWTDQDFWDKYFKPQNFQGEG
jgi:hypothetical protein